MTARMSTPARAAVQKAGVWWRDTGAALRRDENAKRGYSVDAWGRRRGGSSGVWAAGLRQYDVQVYVV